VSAIATRTADSNPNFFSDHSTMSGTSTKPKRGRYPYKKGGNADDYNHIYRPLKISNDTFKSHGKMVGWTVSTEWFDDDWIYENPGANGKAKGKKKNSKVLRTFIMSKCKGRMKDLKSRFMVPARNAIRSARVEDIYLFLRAHCRSLNASEGQLRDWRDQGYELEGMLELISERTNDLKGKLGLTDGQWNHLITLHDKIFSGDIKFEIARKETGTSFMSVDTLIFS